MAALTNDKILRAWEVGAGLHLIDKALVILGEAFPGSSPDEWARLCPGKRNDCLLAVREETFGKEFHGISKCPQCGEGFDFIAQSDEFRSGKWDEWDNDYEIRWENQKMRLRMFDSFDLAAAAGCPDVESARNLLAKRAAGKGFRDGKEASESRFPEGVVRAISEKLSRCDPMAAMKMEADCPECGKNLLIPFNILSFLWKEIEAGAKRLLREVNLLARHYGWREADILSMSSARRHYYLEIAGSAG
jgi:hypothetical protein